MKKLFWIPTTNPSLVYFIPPRLTARRRLFLCATLAMVLTVGLTTVKADFMTVSSSFTNGIVLLPQFDPALGNLASVNLAFGGYVNFWLNVNNPTENDYFGPYGLIVEVQASVSGTSLTATYGDASSSFGGLVPAHSSVIQFVDWGNVGGWGVSFSSADMDFLTGTGYVTVSAPTVTVGCGNPLLSISTISSSFSGDGAGFRYEYTPVPEPSTFILVGFGAATLMIFRRRK